MKRLLLFILFINIYVYTFGVYLENVPFRLVQPNGEVLDVFITGDEFYRRVHDKEGYSIILRGDGWYVYALYNSDLDELEPSKYIVSSQSKEELPMQKGLTISHKKYIEKRREFFEPAGCDISGASSNPLAKSLMQSRNTSKQMNNIIICIGFSDTEEMTYGFDYVDGMYNSNQNNNLRDFFHEMSYGKLEIVSQFYPPADGNILRFYRDSNPRRYYEPYSNKNPSGYTNYGERTDREHSLLQNAIYWVNENYPIPKDINLDINNDGRCDFITFIIKGEVDGWSELLWPHKWTLFNNPASINGKQVWEYNFELDGTSHYFNVGTFCHEGFHVLGAPDLYHYNNKEGYGRSVGPYDIMDQTNNSKPQSMSAYLKYKYANWVTDIVEAEWDKTYEVFSFYTNDGSDPEKPVIVKVPCIGNRQSYIVEYRKKTGNNYDNQNVIPAQGPLIYRIDERFDGNAQYEPYSGTYDEIYLFRGGSIPLEKYYTNGNFSNAPFTGNRKVFNSTTTPYSFTSENVIDEEVIIKDISYNASSDSYTFFYGTGEKYFNIENYSSGINYFEFDIEIKANVKWTVSLEPESAAEWFEFNRRTGVNDFLYPIRYLQEYEGEEDRTATLTFTGNNTSYQVIIGQLGCEHKLDKTTLYFNADGSPTSDGTIKITSKKAWRIKSDKSWVSAYPSSGEGNAVITFTCEPNEFDSRFAILILEGSPCVTTILISQEVSQREVTVSVNNSEGGSVKGGGKYNYGAKVTVEAVPNNGYDFINWTENDEDVSIENQYSFYIEKDRNLTANFVKSETLKIYPNPVKDVLTILRDSDEPSHIEIFTLSGRFVASYPVTKKITQIDISFFDSGIYVIKSGEEKRKHSKYFFKM